MDMVTERNDKTIISLWVMIMMVGTTAIIVGELGQDRDGFPPGYVGGTLAPNGDVIGGHPSEEQMAKYREEAGFSVSIENGQRVFSGPNAEQMAAMDGGYVWR